MYGRWGANPVEDVVVCRRSDTHVELHCHGGQAASDRILADLASAGAGTIAWEEWIANDERSQIRASARIALANATTAFTAEQLLNQYHGALDAQLRRILAAVMAGQIAAARNELKKLLNRAPIGLHLTKPWQIAIIGPPNVGKSSLLNALLGYQRAIVFDQPGTTRDVVRASAAFDGWPMRLSDTAGLRTAGDELELAGVKRAAEEAAAADCILLVFDASRQWTPDDSQLLDSWPHAILVANKADLARENGVPSQLRRSLRTSAINRTGIAELIAAITAQLMPEQIQAAEPLPFTPEQIVELQKISVLLDTGEDGLTCCALLAMLS